MDKKDSVGFRPVDLALVETLEMDGVTVRRSLFNAGVVAWEHVDSDGLPTLATKAVAAELEARYRKWRGLA